MRQPPTALRTLARLCCPAVSPTVRSDETGTKHAAGTLTSCETYLSGYEAGAQGLTGDAFDEMVDGDGAVRASCAAVADLLAQMGSDELDLRRPLGAPSGPRRHVRS